MSPPIHKDWWLAAALTGAALPAAVAQPAGVATTVTQTAPGAATSSTVYIDNANGQKLATGAGQTLHVLFSDQSALTVGPSSQLVIAEYRYDPQTKQGNIRMDMTQGTMRMVGGFISKKNEVVVRTPVATVGILGGITLVSHEGGKTSGVFLFGERMRVSSLDGTQNQFVSRQGFGTSFVNGQLSDPQRVPTNELTSMLGRMEAPPSGAPSGQLLTTAGTPTGGQPVTGLSPGRLQSVGDSSVSPVDNTLRNILAGKPTPQQS